MSFQDEIGSVIGPSVDEGSARVKESVKASCTKRPVPDRPLDDSMRRLSVLT